MKKVAGMLLALVMILSVITCTPFVYATSDYDIPYEVVYRMYNPNSGEHFYTRSAAERQSLYMVGWEAEGIGWVSPQNSSTPIYRMYNGIEHFYTKELGEANYLAEHGWSNEGIEFYSNDNQTVPMFRLFNPNGGAGAHHYTRDGNEKDFLVANGWQYENIAWYTLGIDISSIPLPELPERYANNIKNTNSYATIEADVKLSGTGTGNHAKLLYQTPTAAVSFGLQYDLWAAEPYTNQTYYLCENVESNNPGAQRYFYYGTTSKDAWHHIMMTYDIGGIVSFYVDGNMVGQVWNPSLENGQLYFSAEGAARLDGDTVDANFKNIRLKSHNVYDSTSSWPTYDVVTNPGIGISKTGFDFSNPSTGTVRISGTIVGLGGLDWDSAYDRVSGVVRFGNPIR